MKLVREAMIWTGGAALVVATVTDCLVVVGRQVGFAIHGAIELIQAAVLVAGAVALVAASAAGNHARVRLVVERLGRWKPMAERISELLTIAFVGALLAGSIWLAADLWNSHELSEIAAIPWRWLRLFTNLALVALIAIAIRDLFRSRQP